MKVNNKVSPGGYKFRDFKGSLEDRIIDIESPLKVIIPLLQGFGVEVSPVVAIGDRVFAGQIIGCNDELVSSPIHSSVNGIVTDIKKIISDNRLITIVLIDSDGTDNWQPLEGFNPEWNLLSSDKIQSLLYNSGVTSLDKSGIPTKFKSSVISPDKVADVIVHGINVEPFGVSANFILSDDNLQKFTEGLKIIKKIMPDANFHLAIDKKDISLKNKLIEKLSANDWVDMYTLDAKYPQDSDEVLVPTILDKKYPYGYSAANIGVICLSIQTILHVFEAVTMGKPVIDIIIGLAGTGWKHNAYIKVKIGTPIECISKQYLNKDKEYRLVINSIMTSDIRIDENMSIVKDDKIIIAIEENRNRELLSFVRLGKDRESFSKSFLAHLLPMVKRQSNTNVHGDERPCISCGFCDDVCPVRIIPHLINKHVERDMIDERIVNYGIYKCIGCNLCSFVCPSKIDISGGIKDGQKKLMEEGLSLESFIWPYMDMTIINDYKETMGLD